MNVFTPEFLEMVKGFHEELSEEHPGYTKEVEAIVTLLATVLDELDAQPAPAITALVTVLSSVLLHLDTL